MKVDFDQSVHPASRAQWRAWLKKNHKRADLVWLIFDKKEKRQLSYADAVEEALCFGWIDGIVKPLGAEQYAQRFTPRRNTKNWSAINRKRFEQMEADGLMTEAGRAVGPHLAPPVRQRWREGDPWPPVLKGDLKKKLLALPRSHREAHVRWIIEAKQEETRKRRLEQLAAKL
jgi:uncharacterized protein YdeI (YjbR/CyaY-like superfamily)